MDRRDRSSESQLPVEDLPRNRAPMDPYFGALFQHMRGALAAGGSEMGLGLTLFSLAASIRAVNVIEIGRFHGFSTLCLASALRLLEVGWEEPAQHRSRPDIDYAAIERPIERTVWSIDPFPTDEAAALLRDAGLERFVQLLDARSDEVELLGEADLVFIDGDHSYEGCMADVLRWVPDRLRPGGYFVLHDYFGWYDAVGCNRSPVKRVADELAASGRYQHLLVDTGYMSLVVFRKRDPVIGV